MISAHLHRSPPPGDRHRHRHLARRLAGALAHSGRAAARHRAAAGPGLRRLSGRVGRRARSHGGAADRSRKVVGVDKMIYMKSTSGNDGSYNLTVSFELGTNPDINTVNVNNRVQTAMSQLPHEVQLQGLTVQKRSSSILQFIVLYSEGGKLDPLFITNYVIINVLDEVSRTPGVGQARCSARNNYSMRIWFDTTRLTSLGLDAVRCHSGGAGAECPGADRPARRPAGSRRSAVPIQPPDPGPPDDARRSSARSCIRANPDGSVLRVKDVARVELGAQNEDTSAASTASRRSAIGMYLAPGANAITVAACCECQRWRSCGALSRRAAVRVRSTTPRFSSNDTINAVVKRCSRLRPRRHRRVSVSAAACAPPSFRSSPFRSAWSAVRSPARAGLFGQHSVAAGAWCSPSASWSTMPSSWSRTSNDHGGGAGPLAGRGHQKGDGAGDRAHHRHHAGAAGGVRADRVHLRHLRRAVPAVRGDHQRGGADLGGQRADAFAGALRCIFTSLPASRHHGANWAGHRQGARRLRRRSCARR